MLESSERLGCILPAMFGVQHVDKFMLVDDQLGGDTLVGNSPPESRIERNIKVFKVGTFTDMFGRTKTWTHEMLDKAVANFHALRVANVVPNVPVRRDHTISIKDVGGYLADVRRQGDFLVADIEFTDDDMHQKYKNKTYRNKSLEIGQYVTNAGLMYDPVVLGLAFVDLPSVEGLYHLFTGEDMAIQTAPPSANTDPATPPATPPATDPATPPATPPATESPATPPATEPPVESPATEPPAQHARPPIQTFRLNGGEVTSDYGRVQAHIESLEQFRVETIQTTRAAFVTELAERRVITNPQAEQFRALVQTMTPEQFDVFKAGWAGANESPIFARHDVSDGGSGSPSPAQARADRIGVLEAIVANHRTNGMSDEHIQKLGSWRELQTLKSQN